MNIYIYIYRKTENLALNDLQGLICHKTQPTNQSLSVSLSLLPSIRSAIALINPHDATQCPYKADKYMVFLVGHNLVCSCVGVHMKWCLRSRSYL